jgi:hypothetical protein
VSGGGEVEALVHVIELPVENEFGIVAIVWFIGVGFVMIRGSRK